MLLGRSLPALTLSVLKGTMLAKALAVIVWGRRALLQTPAAENPTEPVWPADKIPKLVGSLRIFA